MSITYLILDNIRSAHNVGAIFRTADAVGIAKIFLVGTTPCPIDRFGRERKEITKTALGAEKTMVWEHEVVFIHLIKKLKKEGFQIIAIEQDLHSIDYRKIKPVEKMVFVLGGEVSGIPPGHLKLCDVIAEIPMRGTKESLNVSVAVGVALFRILGV
ncbi:MAG: TrmH family RNA methyltransferase [Candidatus Paceibacterota bacterium]|jgi:tRNA G18 (ribose-2'-O)-methylase SpoU